MRQLKFRCAHLVLLGNPAQGRGIIVHRIKADEHNGKVWTSRCQHLMLNGFQRLDLERARHPARAIKHFHQPCTSRQRRETESIAALVDQPQGRECGRLDCAGVRTPALAQLRIRAGSEPQEATAGRGLSSSFPVPNAPEADTCAVIPGLLQRQDRHTRNQGKLGPIPERERRPPAQQRALHCCADPGDPQTETWPYSCPSTPIGDD